MSSEFSKDGERVAYQEGVSRINQSLRRIGEFSPTLKDLLAGEMSPHLRQSHPDFPKHSARLPDLKTPQQLAEVMESIVEPREAAKYVSTIGIPEAMVEMEGWRNGWENIGRPRRDDPTINTPLRVFFPNKNQITPGSHKEREYFAVYHRHYVAFHFYLSVDRYNEWVKAGQEISRVLRTEEIEEEVSYTSKRNEIDQTLLPLFQKWPETAEYLRNELQREMDNYDPSSEHKRKVKKLDDARLGFTSEKNAKITLDRAREWVRDPRIVRKLVADRLDAVRKEFSESREEFEGFEMTSEAVEKLCKIPFFNLSEEQQKVVSTYGYMENRAGAMAQLYRLEEEMGV